MADELHLQGIWPSPVQIRRSWALAEARAWNDHVPEAFVRLIRGGAAFLRATSDKLVELAGAPVLSPAILDGSERVWVRSGYQPAFELHMMERPLQAEPAPLGTDIQQSSHPDLETLVAVDRSAFEPFWSMNSAGLREALRSTKTSTTLTVAEDGHIVGYALVGAQWGTAYLQRLAVSKDRMGRGHGADLVRAALSWARGQGSVAIVLNVKPDNTRAMRLYERLGFVRTSAPARVFRYAA